MEIVKLVGVPLAQVLGIIWFVKKYLVPNDEHAKEIAATVAAALTVAQKAELQHQDLERTKHFDQLRRDLTTTIERQAQMSRDDTRSAVSALFLQQDLERLRRQAEKS